MLTIRAAVTAVLAGLVAMALTAGTAGPVSAADEAVTVDSPPGAVSDTIPSGLTVSWLPTTQPVTAAIGEVSTGTFWVSNGTANAIPVRIAPATAIPANNGKLTVRNGADERFPEISYSPSEFVAEPNTTTTVSVTARIPTTLGPGAYVLPTSVQPVLERPRGNIQLEQSIIALVTFEIPGRINAKLEPKFIGAPSSNNAVIRSFPGLPTIQVSRLGHDTLRVFNNSTTSLYSYNEITAAQTPLGTVNFKGHTENLLANFRTDPALYFPGLYRDYPISWAANPFGFGKARITAYVAYHPDPSTIKQVTVSTTVILVSPWWLLALVIWLGAILVVADQRARRHGNNKSRRHASLKASSVAWQAGGSVLLGAAIAIAALFADLIVFAVVGFAGILLALVLAADARKRSVTSATKRILVYQGLIGATLLAGVATLALSVFVSGWSPSIAIGTVAGAGVSTLLAWWIHTWNRYRAIPG